MAEVFKVGLIGCGTVGQGVVRLLQTEAEEIERKTGIRLELARVADKDLSQARRVDVPAEDTTDVSSPAARIASVVSARTSAARFSLPGRSASSARIRPS